MWARLSSFVIWSLVAATVVFWAFRLAVTAPQAPPFAVTVERSAPLRGDLARLFGAAPVVVAAAEPEPAAASSRFRLVGVMAPRSTLPEGTGGYGLALISVDGKPAKAFPVGARLDTGLVLQSVGLRTASIGPAQGDRSVFLELPALPAPATGTLPGATAPSPAAPVPMVNLQRPGTSMAVPPPLPPVMATPPAAVPATPAVPAPPNPSANPADTFRAQ